MKKIIGLTFLVCAATGFAQDAKPLTPQRLIQLAMDAPAVERAAQARLQDAQGALESARRWWVPSTALGVQSFQRTGSLMNAEGVIKTDVSATNSQWAWEWRIGGDLAAPWAAVEAAKWNVEATRFEIEAERDVFVLQCMAAYLAAIGAEQDRVLHLESAATWKQYETELNLLVELGLRPASDALTAASERHQLESIAEQLEASRQELMMRLQGVLDLPADQALQLEWPEWEESVNRDSPSVLPEKQVLDSRYEGAAAVQRGLSREIWVPEIRFSPTLSGFGADFSTLAPTSQWVGSVMWTVPLAQLFKGGVRREAAAQLEMQAAKQQAWEMQHQARLDGLSQRIVSLSAALVKQQKAASLAEEAASQSWARENQGILTPMERVQMERQRLQTRSETLAIEQSLILLSFEKALELGATWRTL
ncbi:MAG: TolC family protein [Flavobacteriales bacterium]|jgi:outer membrane protein TolC